jgi:hypothetical protein
MISPICDIYQLLRETLHISQSPTLKVSISMCDEMVLLLYGVLHATTSTILLVQADASFVAIFLER